MCSGYGCSKYTLAILNAFYLVISLVLIGVAAYATAATKVTSIGLAGGIIACGVFLLIIAIIGMIGALKHHQVLLFFYMIVLGLLFIIQFSVACACLALNKTQQLSLLRKGWEKSSDKIKSDIQYNFNCCGFETLDMNGTSGHPNSGHPSCSSLPCSQPRHTCLTCEEHIYDKLESAVKAVGGVAFFFALTEVAGIVLAFCIRKQQKDADGLEILQ